MKNSVRKSLQASRYHWVLAIALVWGMNVAPASSQETLLPAGSIWRFWDQGTAPVGSWTAPEFSDSEWAVGRAPLGYGEGTEATMISYGTNTSAKYPTTWFRQTFLAESTSSFANLTLRVRRDDGVAVYLNGVEVYRNNLPTGPLAATTLALQAIGGADETAFQTATVAAERLVDGLNVLAVEMHQVSGSSSDLSFDLALEGNLPPLEVHTVYPAAGDADVDPRTMLSVRVDGGSEDGAAVTVKYYLREAGPAPGPDFTVVAVPDTQNYVARINGGDPATFVTQTEWILAERDSRNIAFVTQLGDCVQNGDNQGDDSEWRLATNALYRLEDERRTGLPHGMGYGVAVGNHDQSPFGAAAGTSIFYNQYFGEAHFDGRDYYGGHHGDDNDNHYELFSASGLDFVIVHLEYDMSSNADVLAWAEQVLETHADRRAIVVSHYLMEKGTQAAFGPQGQAVYDALKEKSNFFLMLCGHVPGEGRRLDETNGRQVHTLMSDYQGRVRGGDGWLRLLEFSPSNHVIRVRTYSPTLGQYETDDDSQFELAYDMGNGGAYVLAGEVDATAGSEAIVFPSDTLAPGTAYEWYAEVTDGTRTYTSPAARFETAPGSAMEDSDADGSSDLAEYRAGTDQFSAASVMRVRAMRVGVGQIGLEWDSVPGKVYRVACRADLADAEWVDCSADIVAEQAVTSWSEAKDASWTRRFYVIRLVP